MLNNYINLVIRTRAYTIKSCPLKTKFQRKKKRKKAQCQILSNLKAN